MNKKKIYKGDLGYIKYSRIKKSLLTLLAFIIPVAAYVIAYIYFGTNKNIISIVAIVGCLPACRALVNLIMFFTIRSVPEDEAKALRAHEGTLTCAYELYLTTYEKSTLLDAVAICGNNVVGLATYKKPDVQYVQKHMGNSLRAAGYSSNVTIMTDLKKYLERLDSLNKNADQLREGISFTPDVRYPDFTREELVKYSLLAVSL